MTKQCPMLVSTALVTAALGPRIPQLYVPRFTWVLGGLPSLYEWRFIAKGEFLYYQEDDTPVYAERDMIKIAAFRKGTTDLI